MNIAYILGLGHSGSTFLQLALSTHPDVVGMGEVAKLLKELHNGVEEKDMPLCSCGEKISTCSVWGDLYPKIKGGDMQASLKEILAHFEKNFPQTTMVDASKSLPFLNEYYQPQYHPEHTIKVILVIRDIRSWLSSVKKTNLRKGRKDYGSVFEGYRWLNTNLRNLRFLKKSKFEYKVVVYEDLVFKYETVMADIYRFLELSPSPGNPNPARAHDVYGNRMKNDPSKQGKIVYDHAWMKQGYQPLVSLLLTPQYVFNQQFYALSTVKNQEK
ncbi:MAG: sulfotransferase [Bacteroidia bacterium]|nr:sulfotransferase [Bacteroidia bacterium]